MFTDGWTDVQTDGGTEIRGTDARLIAISPEPFGRGINWMKCQKLPVVCQLYLEFKFGWMVVLG